MRFFECDKCDRSFNEKKQLTLHIEKWHISKHACSLCPEKFFEKFEYMKHLHKNHSMKFTFECKYCYKSFRFLSHYFQHRQIHLFDKSGSIDDQVSKPVCIFTTESKSEVYLFI